MVKMVLYSFFFSDIRIAGFFIISYIITCCGGSYLQGRFFVYSWFWSLFVGYWFLI
jgi:hypothetical protein